MKSLFKSLIVAILTLEARAVLWRYKPKIVAVTGSVGKTSTKDAVYTVLRSHVHARKSEKSFNSEVGVPLTILGLSNAWSDPLKWLENVLDGLLLILWRHEYPTWLVLEVGADRPGDLKQLGGWLHPDILVMTRLPDVPVHIEYFDSKEAVINEKREMRRALKEDGVLIVNGDDPLLVEEPVLGSQRKLTYGFHEPNDMQAHSPEAVYGEGAPCGVRAKVAWLGSEGEVVLNGALGTHHVYPLLAALSVGAIEGYTLPNMLHALEAHTAPLGRMCIHEGIERSTIIDDTYNASPVAVEEALNTLRNLSVRGQKIAVLGDMLELGEYSVEAHRKVGEQAAHCADVLVVVGIRMQQALQAAQDAGQLARAQHIANRASEAGTLVASLLKEGDVVLVKGSQSMRMERAVAALLAHPERDMKRLVRQEEEWQKR